MATRILKRFAQVPEPRVLTGPDGQPILTGPAGFTGPAGKSPAGTGRIQNTPPTSPVQNYPRGNEVDTFGSEDSEDIVTLMRARSAMFVALKAYKPLPDEVSQSFDEYRQAMAQLAQTDDALGTAKQGLKQLDVAFKSESDQANMIRSQGLASLQQQFQGQVSQLENQMRAFVMAGGSPVQPTRPNAAPRPTAPQSPQSLDDAMKMAQANSMERNASMERVAFWNFVAMAGMTLLGTFLPNIIDFFTGKGKDVAEKAHAEGNTPKVNEFLEMDQQRQQLALEMGKQKLVIDQTFQQQVQVLTSNYRQRKQALVEEIKNVTEQLNQFQAIAQQAKQTLTDSMQKERAARAKLDTLVKQVQPYVDEEESGGEPQ